jgi:hypothetical protein
MRPRQRPAQRCDIRRLRDHRNRLLQFADETVEDELEDWMAASGDTSMFS